MNSNAYREIINSPYCNTKNGHISLSENRSNIIIFNKERLNLYEIKIDDGYINNRLEKKCDYLVIREHDKKEIYIELKGSDVKRAMEQIYNTVELLNLNPLDNKKAFIIATRVPKIDSSTQIQMKKFKKNRIDLDIKSTPHEVDITII
ncbi:hypothetical protein PSI22_14575 [Xenorhabdus sp. XENO-7]|uniref:Uncharacterized protein n=1 Tax=Xenorhabdus aichiensis TaxID=3025874 RepID=A0ABT5M6Z6_9GAMM|nr:hypothetical protein [Xenorhabdus aichiensis]MDC9622830.1 hypothetical protein [Xenorhabdus aichiensis]